MTRHRRDDEGRFDGDAPWRARDYERPDADTGQPGEHTSPPWELPGWDDAGPAQRRPRDDSAHPSGPLPQVSSGPLPRVPPESWPGASGPLPPVPQGARRSGEPGYLGARGAGGRDDTGYLRTGYTDPGAGSRYPGDTGADGTGFGCTPG